MQEVGSRDPAGIRPRNVAGQNRALVCDPARDLALLVIGTHGWGDSLVFALRYRHDKSVLEK